VAAALTMVSRVAVAAGVSSAVVVAADLVTGRRQKMRIMNAVWPLTALWAGPLGLGAYFRFGRAPRRHHPPGAGRPQSFSVAVGKATTHCGSGCALGDLLAESFAALVPLTLFGQRLFGSWAYDFIAAYVLGIVFQYFTIKQMSDPSRGQALLRAVKADTLSLLAWQVGMYGWMAIARFVIFGRDLPKTSPVFWFMMQLGMLLGFATAYPVNWWLLRRGIKEPM
jgi:hypothetical protein